MLSEKLEENSPHNKPHYFIAEPNEWEVGEIDSRDRICVTDCEKKAKLIRDALEVFAILNKSEYRCRHER